MREYTVDLKNKTKRMASMSAEAITKYAVAKKAPSVQAQINALEAQQTKRRERDAILTLDGMKWLETLEAQIAALREQLRGKK